MAINENIEKQPLITRNFQQLDDGSVNITEVEIDKVELHPSLVRLQNWDIGQQLNLLYDDINNGLFGEAAKTGEFFEYVKNIKLKYPKN
jgi:hypothetical protein